MNQKYELKTIRKISINNVALGVSALHNFILFYPLNLFLKLDRTQKFRS